MEQLEVDPPRSSLMNLYAGCIPSMHCYLVVTTSSRCRAHVPQTYNREIPRLYLCVSMLTVGVGADSPSTVTCTSTVISTSAVSDSERASSFLSGPDGILLIERLSPMVDRPAERGGPCRSMLFRLWAELGRRDFCLK